MLLKDMFAKPIDRDIKGVIKVGQGDDENIRQELEEYVVTKELQKHFAHFFASYKKGINGDTDKMGVWISGFFGSGKSHFLKILSYLLENKEVNGKKAMEFFVEDKKITDPMVLADMTLAANLASNTDVVLFNIDSKSEMTGKQSKDAIVSVFLKVFNEMQGFCGAIPYIADFERHLVEKNRYEEFQNAFQAKYGKPWVASRNKFDFIQDVLVEILNNMGFMSEAAARNWCEKASEPYSISIEDFANMVHAHIERKGKNHHVVFLVDEVGQYIGEDSKLMLNLQTVTEDLGTACHGKAWVIVTSQQDIDAIAKDMGLRSNDFSKIQGRFDTRISLSSANVDEVIKKRILQKTDTADQTLKLLYEQKSTIIKNLIVFNDGVEKKLYDTDKNFAIVYPFVPYQFNLLASVLTSIRTHGASGKHLAEGERSMLALFKESAMKSKDEENGVLIPFNVFYDALHQFLDHSHSGVILRAQDNEAINPDHKEDCFNVNVLKTLFLVKYVKEIVANAENITSLMIDNIDADRIGLKKKVEEALNVLVRQTLVQKNGDVYVFLTDEEQEVNREIGVQSVEMADVIGKVSELIFEGIFSEKKYRHPSFNGRYNFAFNQDVDDRHYKLSQSNDIGVHILTPISGYGEDDTTYRMMSGQGNKILVVLPNDSAFLDELRGALKIEKYLRQTSSTTLTKFEQIKEAKRIEMKERNWNSKLFLVESLKSAEIYLNGNKANIASKDVTTKINEALGKLVETVYHKLSYIDTPMNESNIYALFTASGQQTLLLDTGTEPNTLALNDMLNFITANSIAHTKTSMKTLLERFMKAPYGFVEADVEWLVGKLFKKGDISFFVNGGLVSLLNKSSEDIVRYITKKENIEKLMIERKEKADDSQKKSTRDVMKELFGKSVANEDDDSIMQKFQNSCKDLLAELDKYEFMEHHDAFPGKKIIESGKTLLRPVLQILSSQEFFKTVHENKDAFFEFVENYEPVKAFFAGKQKDIFSKSLQLMSIYDESKIYVADEVIEGFVKSIMAILENPTPYSEIPQLPELNKGFTDAYTEILKEMEAPAVAAIDEAKKRVLEELDKKSYRDEFSSNYIKQFEDLYEKARTCNNVAVMKSLKLEADTLKIRLLKEMRLRDEQNESKGDTPEHPEIKSKKHKTVSIKSLMAASTWQIESELDLDKKIRDLHEQLLKELQEDTILHIEF